MSLALAHSILFEEISHRHTSLHPFPAFPGDTTLGFGQPPGAQSSGRHYSPQSLPLLFAVKRPLGYVQLKSKLTHPLSCKRVSAGQAARREDPQGRSSSFIRRSCSQSHGNDGVPKARSLLALHSLQTILWHRCTASSSTKFPGSQAPSEGPSCG